MLRLGDVGWVAVHFEDRAILSSDEPLYGSTEWSVILNLVVEPMETEGHYRVVTE